MARWLRCSAVHWFTAYPTAYRECIRHHEAVSRRRCEALERIGGGGLGTGSTQREVCERAGLLIARGARRRKLVLQHNMQRFVRVQSKRFVHSDRRVRLLFTCATVHLHKRWRCGAVVRTFAD
jgi:hypothetical protein